MKTKKNMPSGQSMTKSDVVKPVDPYLESLEAEKREASRRPTVFELAQITTSAISSNVWKGHFVSDPDRKYDHPKAVSPEDYAMDVWVRCSKFIIEQINAAILIHSVTKNRAPDWMQNLRKEMPAIPFEKGLKILVEKQRTADRYKQFRDFLRDCLLEINKDKSHIESRVEHVFKELKTYGFTTRFIEGFKLGFDLWRAEQPRIKANKAAAARWGKKSKKVGPTTNFSDRLRSMELPSDLAFLERGWAKPDSTTAKQA